MKPSMRRTLKGPVRPRLEELEPRLLLSADMPLVDQLVADPAAVVQVELEEPAPEDRPAEVSAVIERREIVFVDTGVEGWEALVADLRAQGDRFADVVLLESERDGVAQISDVLDDYRDLDAVHIVSHGAAGGLQLGSTWLDGDSLGSHDSELRGWADALAGDADLLFYGCELAGSAEGEALVDSIAELTGADVTASTDLTGAAALGGDWDLEYEAGQIETGIAFSAQAQAEWSGRLATPVLGNNTLTLDEGDAIVLTGANLGATDIDDLDSGLIFTVSNVQNGQFELLGVSTTTFTQAEVTNGDVTFVHDGGENAPSYDVSVGDGTDSTTPAAASIFFTNLNDAPVLTGAKGASRRAEE